jgi:hypothetical protein
MESVGETAPAGERLPASTATGESASTESAQPQLAGVTVEDLARFRIAEEWRPRRW